MCDQACFTKRCYWWVTLCVNVCARMGWGGTRWPGQALVTPLMTAADNGKEGTVRILLHAGADVHAENQVAVHAMARTRWWLWCE